MVAGDLNVSLIELNPSDCSSDSLLSLLNEKIPSHTFSLEYLDGWCRVSIDGILSDHGYCLEANYELIKIHGVSARGAIWEGVALGCYTTILIQEHPELPLEKIFGLSDEWAKEILNPSDRQIASC